MDEDWLSSLAPSSYPGYCFAEELIDAPLYEENNEEDDGAFWYTLHVGGGEGISLQIINDPEWQLASALSSLKDSARDGYIGLDFEWRPDSRPGQDNPVALIQLATLSRCLLLQTSCWQGLPTELLSFFGQVTLPSPAGAMMLSLVVAANINKRYLTSMALMQG